MNTWPKRGAAAEGAHLATAPPAPLQEDAGGVEAEQQPLAAGTGCGAAGAARGSGRQPRQRAGCRVGLSPARGAPCQRQRAGTPPGRLPAPSKVCSMPWCARSDRKRAERRRLLAEGRCVTPAAGPCHHSFADSPVVCNQSFMLRLATCSLLCLSLLLSSVLPLTHNCTMPIWQRKWNAKTPDLTTQGAALGC